MSVVVMLDVSGGNVFCHNIYDPELGVHNLKKKKKYNKFNAISWEINCRIC